MKNMQQIKSCIWMRNFYMNQAKMCRDWYDDLCDFYIVYDHYMIHVSYYEKKLKLLIDENDM